MMARRQQLFCNDEAAVMKLKDDMLRVSAQNDWRTLDHGGLAATRVVTVVLLLCFVSAF